MGCHNNAGATMPTPEEILDAAAAAPARTVTDGTETQQHSLKDLIAWADRSTGTVLDGGTNPQGGPRSGWGAVLRPAMVVPPGAP